MSQPNTPENRHVQSFAPNSSRTRPSFSSARTGSSSNTLTSATVLDTNSTEGYSGATFETVPSSIVSFHHPHSFHSNAASNLGSPRISNERHGRRSHETESLLSGRNSMSRSRASSRTPNFRYFSEEEIELAEGVSSTLETADYDINWDGTPTYEQERLHYHNSSGRSSLRSAAGYSLASFRSRSSNRSGVSQGYGGTSNSPPNRSHSQTDGSQQAFGTSPHSSSSSSRYSYRDRIPAQIEDEAGQMSMRSRRSSESSSSNGSFLDDVDQASLPDQALDRKKKSSSYHAEYLKPEYHDRFFPQHVPHLHFQRFYIAEEDLVVGIAGFKTSKIGNLIYYALSFLSLGLFYLTLRWVPRYKVRLCGNKVHLAKAEWVVIENEFGELVITKVDRTWYNRPLSTLLPQEKNHESDEAHSHRHRHHHESEENPNIPIMIQFSYRYFNLIYNPIEDIFKTNSNWTDADWLSLDANNAGLTTSIVEDRVLAFGKNSINLKQKTTGQILFDEVLHPFYVFQIFSIFLWLADDYYYYAACILIISFLSVGDTLLETKKTSQRLSEISHSHCEVRVYRDGFWVQVASSELVPGDVYEVSDPSLNSFPCDSMLLSGDCIVNESMLTGESVPVTKLPATDDTMYQLLDDFQNTQISNLLAKSFLFNGTKIIRVRIGAGQSTALAMVVRTGFSTTKGSLLRSMIFPKPTGFKFYQDSFKYIGFMTVIAMIGFSVSCYNFIRLGLEYRVMVLRALDIITIVVPPALPATLSIGASFAMSRLKRKGIFCIAPTRVNVGGKIDIMCFDKTGTLTEDGLDVLGVHVSELKGHQNSRFGELITNVSGLFDKFSLNDCSSPLDFKSRNFLVSLLTCHSLRVVDGELLGDPLDFKMFQFTKWSYEEDFQDYKFHSLNEERNDSSTLPENSGIAPAVVHPNADDPNNKFTDNDPSNLLGVVRSFEFVAELRRMSVVVKPYGENVFWSFTKGAPEVVSEICNKSTLPSNYHELLQYYTHNGYRVIACAGKTLPKHTWRYAQKVTRDEIESNLEFLGLIVFENKLKSATIPTLFKLREAAIRSVMCTGDNVLTAISVGRECGLVREKHVFVPQINDNVGTNEDLIIWQDVDNPDLMLDGITLKPTNGSVDYTIAVTGDVFRLLFKNNEILPDSYINEVLLKSSIYARMSPDEKHELVGQLQKLDFVVGFCGDGANDCGALKAADVGVSLSEAEASVAAPFTSNAYDISCMLDVIKEGRASLTTSFSCFQYMSLYSATQFVTVTILYSRGINLGDFQFLYIDLFLIVPIAIFMSWSKPYHKLVKKRPSANLVSLKILVPLLVNIGIILIFQVVAWLACQRMPWYQIPVVGGDDAVQSSDNTVLFFFANFQYVFTAVVLSVGPPYRESMSKNIGFITDVIISLLLNVALMMIPPDSWLGEVFQITQISTEFKIFLLVWSFLNYYAQLHIPGKFKKMFPKKQSSKRYKNILNNRKLECV
ncbi:LANO_0H17634g1_1 [Lachancea nothofagi CBS 11611]|uniref:Cation-transporting ATPase n=1 Tax=Lachancea nothofagi CBS 11611 TaxID=1266666 RepID=A0A1G4KN30_9SACH|nr:LANO_0H17634g1_1 [Lachancea nothofagi CBS 11611]